MYRYSGVVQYSLNPWGFMPVGIAKVKVADQYSGRGGVVSSILGSKALNRGPGVSSGTQSSLGEE